MRPYAGVTPAVPVGQRPASRRLGSPAAGRHPKDVLLRASLRRYEQIVLAARHFSFMRKQRAFERQAAAIAGEASIGADDAMAGDNQSYGVGAVCKTHGAGAVRSTELCSERAIARGLAEGDFQQCIPDLMLEWRSFRRELEIEFLPRSITVFAYLH